MMLIHAVRVWAVVNSKGKVYAVKFFRGPGGKVIMVLVLGVFAFGSVVSMVSVL